MRELLFLLSAILLSIILLAFLSGRLFMGGRVVYRSNDRQVFYLGIFSYMVIAVLSVLFGKEL